MKTFIWTFFKTFSALFVRCFASFFTLFSFFKHVSFLKIFYYCVEHSALGESAEKAFTPRDLENFRGTPLPTLSKTRPQNHEIFRGFLGLYFWKTPSFRVAFGRVNKNFKWFLVELGAGRKEGKFLHWPAPTWTKRKEGCLEQLVPNRLKNKRFLV